MIFIDMKKLIPFIFGLVLLAGCVTDGTVGTTVYYEQTYWQPPIVVYESYPVYIHPRPYIHPWHPVIVPPPHRPPVIVPPRPPHVINPPRQPNPPIHPNVVPRNTGRR